MFLRDELPFTITGSGDRRPFYNTHFEQFFTSDFKPLGWDSVGNALDEESQLPAHMAPIGSLCDTMGHTYESPDRTDSTEAHSSTSAIDPVPQDFTRSLTVVRSYLTKLFSSLHQPVSDTSNPLHTSRTMPRPWNVIEEDDSSSDDEDATCRVWLASHGHASFASDSQIVVRRIMRTSTAPREGLEPIVVTDEEAVALPSSSSRKRAFRAVEAVSDEIDPPEDASVISLDSEYSDGRGSPSSLSSSDAEDSDGDVDGGRFVTQLSWSM